MRQLKVFAVTAGVISLGGCGGGGTNSTPMPPPAPAVSTSFSDLGADIAFTSNAAILRFDPGAPSGPGFAISYSAQSKSYTVSRGGNTQTFSPSDVSSAAGSSGLSDPGDQFTFYEKSSDATRDFMMLSNAGNVGQAQYVSGGIWARTDENDAIFHAFSYGFSTADAATPRSGSASFDIRATGMTQIFTEIHGLIGEGSITADFAAGSVELAGLMRSIDPSREALGGAFLVSGATTMSSTANGFSGTLYSNHYSGDLTGQFNGKFYGPSAEEIGGAFSLVDDRHFFGVGEFVGSRGNLAPYFLNDPNAGVRNLSAFRYFDTDARKSNITGQPTNGTYRLESSKKPLHVLMAYDPGSGYILSENGPIISFPSQLASSLPGREVWSNYSTQPLYIENPESPESRINLTYASFASWIPTPYSSNGFSALSIIYGDLTAPSQMPKTGTAAYSGTILGTAEKNGMGYSLSGTSTFDVNFVNGAVTGNASMTGSPFQSTSGLPPFTVGLDLVDGHILRGTPIWSGSVRSGGQHVGTIDARFYGPAAAEMAGFWDASVVQGADMINMAGTVFGKKQ